MARTATPAVARQPSRRAHKRRAQKATTTTISYGPVAAAYSAALLSEPDPEGLDRLLRKYGSSTTWTYIAVNRVANANAQIPFQIIKKEREGLPNAIVRGRAAGLRDLLDTPNPFQSRFDFIEQGSVSMELTGNLYIEKAARDKLGRPHELHILNPSKMRVVPDRNKTVAGYVLDVNGREIVFARDEIIHVKYAHPTNDFYGFSPATAARFAMDTDRGAVEWNRNFMNKGAWPAGALESEEPVDEITARRLRAEIRRVAQGGKEKVGQILLLGGGLKYNKIALGPKEVDWLDARRMSRDEILAIYGVPFAVASMFSNESTTSRSAGVAQQVINFYLFTVFPKRAKIVGALNRDLAPLFPGGLEIIDDVRNIPALKDDVAKELVRAQTFRTLTASGWSVEMALAELYPHVPSPSWGQVVWMNSSMVPISGPSNPFAANPNAPPPDTNNPTDPTDPSESNPPNLNADKLVELAETRAMLEHLGLDERHVEAVMGMLSGKPVSELA